MSQKTFFGQALFGIITGTIGTMLVWFLAAAVSPDLYASGFGGGVGRITLAVAITGVVTNCFAGAVVGWILVWRRVAVQYWYAISALVLVGTGINAIVGATTVQTAIWLNVMHIVVAVPFVPAIGSLLPRRRTASSREHAGNVTLQPAS